MSSCVGWLASENCLGRDCVLLRVTGKACKGLATLSTHNFPPHTWIRSNGLARRSPRNKRWFFRQPVMQTVPGHRGRIGYDSDLNRGSSHHGRFAEKNRPILVLIRTIGLCHTRSTTGLNAVAWIKFKLNRLDERCRPLWRAVRSALIG